VRLQMILNGSRMGWDFWQPQPVGLGRRAAAPAPRGMLNVPIGVEHVRYTWGGGPALLDDEDCEERPDGEELDDDELDEERLDEEELDEERLDEGWPDDEMLDGGGLGEDDFDEDDEDEDLDDEEEDIRASSRSD
jgi:hypothetical protein